MKRGLQILAIVLGMIAAVGVRAGQYEQLMQTQRLLEDRVNALVRLFDPQGFSVVNIDLKKEREPVPGMPFFYDDFTLPSEDRLNIERLKVSVISRLDALPEEAQSLIREALRTFSPRVEISIKRVPQLAPAMRPPIPEMRVSFPENSNWANSLFGNPLVLGAFGVFALLSIFGIVILWRLSGGLRQGIGSVSSSLNQGLAGLKESLEGGIGGSATTESGALTTVGGGVSATFGTSAWPQLSTESCLALLADCYWCEKDGYAAFIWDQLSVTQRMNVVTAWPALEKYIRHVQGVVPKDLGLHSDVNYLSPVAIHLFDNASLTEQVKRFPGLLRRLSPLRSDALGIGVEERLGLQAKAGESATLPDWTSLPPSKERTLRSYPKVRLVSENGEAEAINLRELPVEAKEQFITLAWMVQLPRERVTHLLDGFSARELAQAWVGPSALLSYLSECLAPKKRELVESYRKAVAPSRDSEVFTRLHRLSMEAFRQERERAQGEGIPNAQAA